MFDYNRNRELRMVVVKARAIAIKEAAKEFNIEFKIVAEAGELYSTNSGYAGKVQKGMKLVSILPPPQLKDLKTFWNRVDQLQSK